MKKVLCLVTVMLAVLGFISCGDSDDDDYIKSAPMAPCRENTFPLYVESDIKQDDFPLYFLNGVSDLPYVEIDDFNALLKKLYEEEYKSVEIEVSKEGSVVTCVRKNETYDVDVPVTFDFAKDIIRFQDYDMFIMPPNRSTILDLTWCKFLNDENEPCLIQKIAPVYFPRLGEPLEINLGNYGIDMVIKDGKYLVPLQTVSDFFIAPTFTRSVYFNGKSIIISEKLSDKEVEDLYYKGNIGERSSELTEFGYGELCIMLDNLYGLKEHHGISSFDNLFQTIGYTPVSSSRAVIPERSFKSLLLGQHVIDADGAIYSLIYNFLDDNHVNWNNFSYLAGKPENNLPTAGVSRERMYEYRRIYKEARNKCYPDGIPGYEEVGNTAFITFDEFFMEKDYMTNNDKYYTTSLDKIPETDTIALILKAHAKITRENSPIENVVIDFSVNGGGLVDTAVFVVSWFLGKSTFSVKNTMTGAICSSSYRCDANLDREFDEEDTLGDKKLFCLISPFSFSCGNLVPNVFKESTKVTLIGKKSGGGACVVQPISSAWGTSFQISGPYRLSYMKNGSFYDVDQGAEPDYPLSSPESYYNREELVDYINSFK